MYKSEVREKMTGLFNESNLKEAVFEKPLNAKGDYSMTGILIALADAGKISKPDCVTYRDLFEKS